MEGEYVTEELSRIGVVALAAALETKKWSGAGPQATYEEGMTELMVVMEEYEREWSSPDENGEMGMDRFEAMFKRMEGWEKMLKEAKKVETEKVEARDDADADAEGSDTSRQKAPDIYDTAKGRLIDALQPLVDYYTREHPTCTWTHPRSPRR